MGEAAAEHKAHDLYFKTPATLLLQDEKLTLDALSHPRSGSGTVDFQEFVGGLSAFSSKGGRDEKLRCK